MRNTREFDWGNLRRLGKVLLHGLVLWDLFIGLICSTVGLFLEVDPL